MKKTKFFITLFSTLFCISALSFSAKGKLEDVVVKEKDTLKIESEKRPIKINLDHAVVLEATIITEEYFLSKLSTDLKTMKMINPKKIKSTGPISPWLSDIKKNPVAAIHLDVNEPVVNSWELIVTDNSSNVFRTYTGEGSVPGSIGLTGRDEEGNFMKPGNIYSYILKIDVGGKGKKTIIGKPFSVNAAIHQEDDGLYIGIAPESLFKTKKGAKLTKNGKKLVVEASDIMIKENFDLPIDVIAYSESESIAKKQADSIARHLSKILVMPKDEIYTEGVKDAPENYHVDIVILNREEKK
ncbi:hypothetical protein ACFL58_02695 [Elusimicrobiota bacterium]